MLPNLDYSSLGLENIPFPIVPAITFMEQINFIEKSLGYLIENGNDLHKNLFDQIFNDLVHNHFKNVFLRLNCIKTNFYWKHNDYGIYIDKNPSTEIFNGNNHIILSLIRKELYYGTLRWFILIGNESCLFFRMDSNGVLLWSIIVDGLKYFFLTLILIFPHFISELNLVKDFEGKNHQKLLKDSKFFQDLYESTNCRLNMDLNNKIHSLSYLLINLQKELISLYSEKCEKYVKNIINKGSSNFLVYFRNTNRLIDLKRIDDKSSLANLSFFLNNKEIINFILEFHPLIALQQFPSLVDNEDIERSGIYYTPLSLVEIVVPKTINKFLDLTSNPFKFDTKIFDPAMGTGLLLIYALEYLVNLILHRSIKSNMNFILIRQITLKKCIFGNDIDKNAVNFAISYFSNFCWIKSSYVIQNFKISNFLESYIKKRSDKIKFDIIISNPPYLPLHSRFTKYDHNNDILPIIKEKLPDFCGRRDNFYLFFLGICLEAYLSPKSGVLGFIIDRTFLDLPSYKQIRKKLISDYNLIYILDDYCFTLATVDLSIIILTNKSKNNHHTIWQKTIDGKIKSIPQIYFKSQPYHSITYQIKEEILDEIEKLSIQLGSICKISSGLEYGSLLKSKFLCDKPQENFFPAIDGSNNLPYPYLLFWVPNRPNSYVRFDKKYEKYLINTKQNYSSLNKKVLLISGDKKRFLGPKLFLRQSSTRFIGVYDENKFFALRNIHLIYEVEPPYSLLFILGFLNSSLGLWLGEKLNIIRKSGSKRYPQIRINDLKRCPIINLYSLSENELSIVNEITSLVHDCQKIGTLISDVLKKIWENLLKDKKILNKNLSQRYFVRLCLTNSLCNFLPSKRINSQIFQDQKIILNLLDNLNSKKNQLDNLFFSLYNIDQDLRKTIEIKDYVFLNRVS